MIYEGNRQDKTPLDVVIGSISEGTSPNAKEIVVMDAGILNQGYYLCLMSRMRWSIQAGSSSS